MAMRPFAPGKTACAVTAKPPGATKAAMLTAAKLTAIPVRPANTTPEIGGQRKPPTVRHNREFPYNRCTEILRFQCAGVTRRKSVARA